MFRAVSVLGGVWACLAAATFCVQAQDGANAPRGPLELNPMLGKPPPNSKAKPAKRAPKPMPDAVADAAPDPKPLHSVKPVGKFAAKAPTKPAKKPAAAQGVKPVVSRLEPQAVERASELPTGSIKPPASSEKGDKEAVEPQKQIGEARPPFDEYVVAQFCNSLSSAASDGRLAWQAKRLEEMEGRLRDRIAELEAKRAETADWLKRREMALRMADEAVVAIYSKMKPDAAAAQFSAMDESGAAAILSKLNPRTASTFLNEIDASRAARIAAEMAGVGQKREIARSVP